MNYVVMFSGGITSWATAKRIVGRHGATNVTLLFADTRIEDEDLYRFLSEAAANVGAPLVRVEDGRTPWEVFHDVRRMGNSHVAPCSHLLKQIPCRKWMKENTDPANTTVALGLDWTEVHRVDRAIAHWEPWAAECPLTQAPYQTKRQMLDMARAEGITPPRTYALGFPHSNCGGFCVRQGQAGFELLLRQFPERYRSHEAQEELLRVYLGKEVSIMRDRSGGRTRPLTMREFRQGVESSRQLDLFDWGGCGCFTEE